jgi:O-antigen/teichoic acid export membrane protein
MTGSGLSRARKLLEGWSANLLQMALGIAQQVALVPIFLHFWSSDILAAWLAIYAAGNLILVADAGLQLRAINRFLAFKSSVDCDGRTGRFYAAMRRIYFGLVGSLAVALLIAMKFLPPSAMLGFRAVAHFDLAFGVMTVGMLLTLPVNIAAALYRARGLYGRAVKLVNLGMIGALLGQLAAVAATQSLLAMTFVYVATQLLVTLFFLAVDAPRQFPFLRAARAKESWRWIVGQFRRGFPFAIANATEMALLFLPVLLVSAFVSDRVAVAQWGLTRVIVGLLRTLCYQVTLPLAAELGHDYAVGQKEQLRHLYARGSVFVTLLASGVVSGLLPFWSDFFALWTHGSVPYDRVLTLTLLIGTGAMAPSILALNFANYSDRGELLVRTKGLQLAVFLVLSVTLIRPMGPLGAAIAIVASDLLVQFGLLALIIMGQTLQHPLRHVAFLAIVASVITLTGCGLGTAIGLFVPGTGLVRFVIECTLWLAAVAVIASPLTSKGLRDRLIAAIPR